MVSTYLQVINPTLRPLLACDQCKALRIHTGSVGPATSNMDFNFL